MPITHDYSGGGGGSRFDSVLHVLGVVPKYGGRTLSNLEDAAWNTIPGLWHMTGEATHDPLGLLREMGDQMVTDFSHPLRNPGYTLLDAAGLLPVVGTPFKIARAAEIVGRAGALPAELSTLEAATKLGRSAERARIVNPKTGAPVSTGKQVLRELFTRLPEEERLLRLEKPEDLSQLGDVVDLPSAKTSATDAADLGADAKVLDFPHIKGEESLGNMEAQTTHGWWYSRDPTIRAAQKLVNKAYDAKFSDGVPPPIWRVLPPFWRTQAGRVNTALKGQNLINRMTSRTKAARYAAEFATRSDPEQVAVRLVAEMTTPESVLSFHQKILDMGLPAKFARETEQRIATIQEAQKYLENTKVILNDGSEHIVPKVRAEYPELQTFVDRSREISNDRTLASRVAGVLTPDSQYRRINGPRNLILSGKIPENLGFLTKERDRYIRLKQPKKVAEFEKKIREELGQLQLEGLGPEEELVTGETAKELAEMVSQQTGGGFRVPYKVEKPLNLSFGQDAFRRAFTGKKPRVPGTFTHEFHGNILKLGGGDANVAKLLAESYTEAHRFISLVHARNFLLANARDTPEGIPLQFRQLIRTDEYFKANQAPTYQKAGEYAQRSPEQELLAKESLTPEDSIAGGKLYEGMRQNIFPEFGQIAKDTWDAMVGKDGKTYQPVKGYKWIDKRLLGGLDQKNPLIGVFENGVVKRLIHTADIVNNVQKAMILYLKPSYMLPNILGNIGLTLVQQGFLMPFNLAKTFRLRQVLDKQTLAQIKGSVGQGISESTLDVTTGNLHNAVYQGGNWLADKYGKIIDDPFREASFVHEASRSGFKTKEEITALVNDPKFADEFKLVVDRANEALINYERMGPGEQAFLKRMVFFYPWVKGSSRYTSTFWKQHPLATGVTGLSGQLGTERGERIFGNLPSYAEGMIPYDISNPDRPITGGTMSTSVFGTSAELANLLTNVIVHNPNRDLSLSKNLAPVDAGLLAFLTSGISTTLGHPGSEPVYKSALKETFGGNPLKTLYLTAFKGQGSGGGPVETSLFPDKDRLDPWLKFFLTGALTPRPYNKQLGEYKAYKQQHPPYVP